MHKIRAAVRQGAQAVRHFDRLSQVIVFKQIYRSAGNPCKPAKPLIFKACEAAKVTYQQSYPQQLWTIIKSPLNQALSPSCEGETKKTAKK
jgi:hypothetical protein